MSLPIARARRKNVPSIQRSPYSSTRSHSRTQSSKPSVVMSQASASSPTSHSSLTSRSSESTRAKLLVAALVGRQRRRRRGVSTPRSTRVLAEARSRLGQLVEVAHRRARARRDLAQRRAAAGPQLAVLPVPEELVGLARGARPRVEHRLAVLDDEHRVAGLVAGQVGVRGVRPEAVVGVVGAHLEAAGRDDQPLAGEGSASRARRRGRPGGHGVRRQVELAVAPARAHEGGVGLGHGLVVALGAGGRVGVVLGNGRCVGVVVAHAVTVRRAEPRCRRQLAPWRPPIGSARMTGAAEFRAAARRRRPSLPPVPAGAAPSAAPPRQPSCSPSLVTLALLARRRGDGPGAARQQRPERARQSGWCSRLLPVGPAGRLLPLARPLRARAGAAARARVRLGRPRRHRGRPGPAGARPVRARHDRGLVGGRRRADHRGGRQGPLRAAPAVGRGGTSSTASSTASSTPGSSASGSRSPRTSSTSAAPTWAVPRLGPGGLGSADRRLRRPRHLQPVRAPAVHRRSSASASASPSSRRTPAAVARAARRLRRSRCSRTRPGTARRSSPAGSSSCSPTSSRWCPAFLMLVGLRDLGPPPRGADAHPRARRRRHPRLPRPGRGAVAGAAPRTPRRAVATRARSAAPWPSR